MSRWTTKQHNWNIYMNMPLGISNTLLLLNVILTLWDFPVLMEKVETDLNIQFPS